MEILKVENLRVWFELNGTVAKAVDGISFDLNQGEVLALVGESGCGKTVTALTIMRLLDIPPAKIVSGKIIFGGKNLLDIPEKEMQKVRGGKIAMVFQEPMTSLNPVLTIGEQVAETIMLHKGASKKEALKETIELLKTVRIPDPESRIKQYPHQMSGGMRQRVMIAMAIACKPDILIADEPTTALDVTVQAQILELLKQLQKDFQMSLILITHDLGIVYEFANKICVMYAGKIVETATVRELFSHPNHPYSIALLNSRPKSGETKSRLQAIDGFVPNATNLPSGCRFHPRCPLTKEICKSNEPPTKKISETHFVNCIL